MGGISKSSNHCDRTDTSSFEVHSTLYTSVAVTKESMNPVSMLQCSELVKCISTIA